MIFEARSSSRRWTTVTLVANLVRKIASSIAVSPPPTTTISLPRKKNPSQVAQADTPCPISTLSDSIPSALAVAPVATIRLSQVYTRPWSLPTRKGRRSSFTSITVSKRQSAPKRWACLRILSTRSGPMMPASKPG